MNSLVRLTVVIACAVVSACAKPGRDAAPVLWAAADAEIIGGPKELAIPAAVRMKENCLLKSYRDRLADGRECTGSEFPDHRPQLGLALSGGGMRSASVAIGVLQALEERGLLKEVDIISSVSGGGYANYWLATRAYWSDAQNMATTRHPTILAATSASPFDRRDLFATYFNYCWGGLKDHAAVEALGEKWRDSGDSNLRTISAPRCEMYRFGEDRLDAKPPYRIDPRANREISHSRRFQRHLESYGALMVSQDTLAGPKTDRALVALEGAGSLLTWIVLTPFHWVANGLLNAQVNLNNLEWFYEAGIERTFGLYPTQWGLEGRPNARFFDWGPLFAVNPMIPELASSARKGSSPMVIFNGTAAYGGRLKWARDAKWSGFSRDLSDVVYEFTPVAYGNDAFGYCPYDQEADVFGVKCFKTPIPDLGEIVMISGAAVDDLITLGSPIKQVSTNLLVDVSNLALGKFVKNPRVAPMPRVFKRLVPWPFYLQQKYDEKRATIYLSDGGHSENLGVYALLKRGTRNIIVVDAEYETRTSSNESLAIFDSFQRLRCHLHREHGMKIEAADDRRESAALTRPYSGPACSGAPNRGEIGFDFLRTAPVLLFDVCPQEGSCDGKRSRLIYLKLSVDGIRAPLLLTSPEGSQHKALLEAAQSCDRPQDPYSCAVYFQRQYAIHTESLYPHDSTSDIWYPKKQYVAYRALGYDISRMIKEEDFLQSQ